VGWDRHKLPCDGTDKYAPWTILDVVLAKEVWEWRF